MQRKPTNNRNGRGPNVDEKLFQGWLKEQPCIWCDNENGSIVDHCRGATFSNNKTHCGHWFCVSNCLICDTQKTIHGKRLGNESDAWEELAERYEQETGRIVPESIKQAIGMWGR